MTEGNGAGRIYWVGGSKGRVGKSMMTVATVDHLLEQGAKRAPRRMRHVEPGRMEGIPGAGRDGARRPRRGGRLDPPRQHVRPAPRRGRGGQHGGAHNLAVKQYGGTLDSSLEELGSQLVALWVINRQRDSLELLREYIDAVPKAAVHVVRNGYFGDEKKFELYNGSKIREEVEGRGGKSITLPDLADRVADDIYVRRISLKVASKELPIGNRAELGRWRGEVRKVLAGVLP